MMNRMFDTVAFGVPLSLFPQWTEMLERHKKHNLFERGDTLVALGGLTWNKFKKETRSKPLIEKIKAVNDLWNKRIWKEDEKNWGVKDKWATPLEFCYKGGDCEDYAIAKMLSLKALNADCPMRFVIGKKKERGHAILVVQVDSKLLVLDNESNDLMPDYLYSNFEPKDSLTEDKAWAHVKRVSI